MTNVIDRLLWCYSTEIGRSIVWLLTTEPDAWRSTDSYDLRHDTAEISIWIANKAYGLSIKYGSGFGEREVWPPWADRQLIHRQVKLRRIPSPETRRAKALTRHVTRYADKHIAPQ